MILVHVLRCGVCRSAVSEETIVYRPPMVTDAPPLRRSVCLGCVQPELARLRTIGATIIGIADAA